jgi:uncharacterized protein (DUF4415 family)
MKKLSAESRRKYLRNIAEIKDEDIDTSDIPELTAEQFRRGIRGMLYRPMKRPITIRLDADIIEWLKREGPGYQTKANRLLRSAMVESFSPRKKCQVAAGTTIPQKRKSGAR